MVQLTSTGEIMALNEADQFQPGKSQFECGFFSCAMVRSAAPPGKAPIRSVQAVIDDAEAWYAQYNGNDDISNLYGMTLDQLYSLIKQMTYGYIPISLSNDPEGFIKGWIRNGYPVIGAVDETCLHDMELGGQVPYPWNPSGSHVIVITGIALDGNFLVRDSANCTNLYDPNSLRPGPRKYDAGQLVGGLVSATAVITYWLSTPPAGFDPRSSIMPTIPNGWQYDSVKKILKAPNGYEIRDGFCQHVLNNPWDPNNVPLENEAWVDPLEVGNPSLGAGSRQRFRTATLGYTAKMGVYVMWTGQELIALSKLISQLQAAQNGAEVKALTDKLAQANQLATQLVNATK